MTDPTAPPTPTQRTARRRRRSVAIGLAAAAALGVAVLASRGDDGDARDEAAPAAEGGAGTERSTTEPAGSGADRTTTSAAGPTSTTTRAAPGTTATTGPPATTTTGSAPVPTAPVDLPGFSDEDPTDAPAVPVGPQGPVSPAACAPTGPPTIASSLTDGPSSDGKAWRTVGHLEGNCGGSSGPFTTAGVDTRIVVRSDADQFLAFLDDTAAPDANGGYADVVCRSRCSDQGVLTIPAGSYVLRVQATDGPWVADVQEYR